MRVWDPELKNKSRRVQLYKLLANSILWLAAAALVGNGLRWLFPALNWTAIGVWLIPLGVLMGVLGPVAVIFQTSFRSGIVRYPQMWRRFCRGLNPYIGPRCASCDFDVDDGQTRRVTKLTR